MYVSNLRDFRGAVEGYFGGKGRYLATAGSENDPSRGYVRFLLYEALHFRFIVGDPLHNGLGVSRQIDGNESISQFALGDLTLIGNDEASVLNAFNVVDTYCRLLLPDKYLKLFGA